MKTKGLKEGLDQKVKYYMKSTFEIIKKFHEIDNGHSTSEL